MPRQNNAATGAKYTMNLVQTGAEIRPRGDRVDGHHRVARLVGKWDVLGGPVGDDNATIALPIMAAAEGLGAHDRGWVDEVQTEPWMTRGENGSQGTGSAAHLA